MNSLVVALLGGSAVLSMEDALAKQNPARLTRGMKGSQVNAKEQHGRAN